MDAFEQAKLKLYESNVAVNAALTELGTVLIQVVKEYTEALARADALERELARTKLLMNSLATVHDETKAQVEALQTLVNGFVELLNDPELTVEDCSPGWWTTRDDLKERSKELLEGSR